MNPNINKWILVNQLFKMKLTVPPTLLFSILLISRHSAKADFIYEDFNKTLGLNINGDAATFGCKINETYSTYHEQIAKRLNRENFNETDLTSKDVIGKGSISHEYKQTVRTNVKTPDEDLEMHEMEAQFGHRTTYVPGLNSGCKRRLRLTPSSASQVGSVFYEKRLPVIRGFDTIFSFQVTEHSRVCSDHVVSTTSTKHHRSCAIHGGDGLAFVIHSDPNGPYALGGDGQGLGYAGISNSLSIEFDMWTNVNTQGSDDFFSDHISIHSGSTGPNSDQSHTKLGHSRALELADGKIHVARIQYLPYVEERYLRKMTANDNLLPFIKDNGEGRRLGTLAIFVDDGIDDDMPILAIPLNLSVLLELPQSLAYVGFTASTGRKWENHDIIHWHWCDSEQCQGDVDEIKRFNPV